MKYFHPKKYWRLVKEWSYSFFWYYIMPDSCYLKYRYKQMFGATLNLKNPQTFNEKIQWLKINDRNPLYHKLVDKYEVKTIVANIIGKEYIIPTISERVSTLYELDQSKLPNQFVLKCNHDAASVVVCKDKSTFDWEKAEIKLNQCLHRDYYHFENKQWVYKGIKPYIFAEQYMEDVETQDLPDYKFYCFNGNVKCIFVGRDRFTSEKGVLVNLYDRDWNKLPFEHYHPNYEGNIPRPQNLDEMIEIAQKLSNYVDNSFLRIDLYDINGKIYFGEFTFYPGGGFEEFRPVEWDYILGSWIKLPIDK